MWWRYHAFWVRHGRLALLRERQALSDPVILGKVMQAFWGAIFGAGQEHDIQKPRNGGGDKEGSLLPRQRGVS